MLKYKSKFILATAILLFVISKANLPVSAAAWPLSGDIGSHDPTLAKDGNTWWSPSTGAGLPMKYSNDGKVWRQGIPVFSSELSWWRQYAPNMGKNDVWAPDLKFFNGRYWMYYSVSEFGKNNSAIGLMSCTSVNKGDWKDEGVVLSSKAGKDSFNAIDPNLVIDASGKPWLVYGSWFDGLHVVRLNASTMKPSGTKYSIAKRNGGIEGASMIYANGYYYLFASIDKCCNGVNSTYKTVYGRSKNITGPFVNKQGVDMRNGGYSLLDSGNSRWKGPGGEYVYQNGSSWVIARHAYDAQNNGAPTLLISDLYFDSNKWPTY
ncbi:glycoside hydrolase family 43 protein [Anaerosacchariphilus polymeriproducens]|uniref:Endo-alpha-(1->5)-L-arabinanase n=1 Tax=Anaerosacchariphilus polymeriproducens TaxID=1812858 RepID=A0A371B075_9FIRM|nr:glycoside hydrolase family 43 protein [Anaerosacchariphilus polymeriproducens]RDU25142.1 arabinan endo-1,5-alpha-L-arabinosidase [Anaerosacchariphilus polymeriproducens]